MPGNQRIENTTPKMFRLWRYHIDKLIYTTTENQTGSYSSIISRTVVDTFSLELSFQISSGFSCVPSNMCTAASALSRMASINTPGRKRINVKRTYQPTNRGKQLMKGETKRGNKLFLILSLLTFGPTSLSEVILEKSSAVCVRTWGCVQLQKRSSK